MCDIYVGLYLTAEADPLWGWRVYLGGREVKKGASVAGLMDELSHGHPSVIRGKGLELKGGAG